MTRPGLLKSQINNRYSVKRTHTPFGNAVKDFRSWIREKFACIRPASRSLVTSATQKYPRFHGSKMLHSVARSRWRLND